MKRTITASMIALMAFLVVGTAGAQPNRFDRLEKGGRGEGNARQGRHFRPERLPLRLLARALDLSEEQIEEVRNLREQSKEAAKPIREQQRASRAELRQLLEQENPSATEVGELVLSARSFNQQLKQVRDDFVAAFEGLLTPEQQEKLQELKDRRRSGGPGRRARRASRSPRGN